MSTSREPESNVKYPFWAWKRSKDLQQGKGAEKRLVWAVEIPPALVTGLENGLQVCLLEVTLSAKTIMPPLRRAFYSPMIRVCCRTKVFRAAEDGNWLWCNARTLAK